MNLKLQTKSEEKFFMYKHKLHNTQQAKHNGQDNFWDCPRNLLNGYATWM
jgi:hypothetical protein